MALPQHVLDMLNDEGNAVEVKRGEEIFEGTDYPRTWDGFIGQESAKEELRVAALSAKARGARMDHVKLVSGIAGVGKTTLATLLTAEFGAGLVRTAGPLTQQDFVNLLQPMRDHDVLFIDEWHLMFTGSRTRADFLLPFMLEGKLYTKRGAQECPDITIVAATTDDGAGPDTFFDRFVTTPELTAYTPEEGARICAGLSARMRTPVPMDALSAISTAADQNPRRMRKILSKIRDLSHAYPDSHPNLEKAFQWAGVSADGLSRIARDILILLLLAPDNTLALETIKGKLTEPGPIAQHEHQLLQRQLVDITGRGRRLTAHGLLRAQEEARARAA